MLKRPQSANPLMALKPRDWPQYLKWRDGRPRWEPGPGLRKSGHQGRDLRYPDGGWMTKGDAVEAAEAINRSITPGQPTVSLRPPERSLSALLDYVEKLPKFRDDAGAPGGVQPPKKQTGKRLARSTRLNYLSHFRILREWAGGEAVAALKRADTVTLYDALVEGRGLTMANRVLSSLHMALEIARQDLEWITHNRAAGIDTMAEDGRLVMWTPDETAAFIAAADWLGMEDIADAHVIGLMTLQRRSDILPMLELTPEQGVYRIVQSKTGRTAYVPETRLLTARLALARARKAARWPAITYRHEIISTRTGAPFARDGSTFTHEYRMVRAVASGLQLALDQVFPQGARIDWTRNRPFTFMPSIWDKRFADLRDTGVTLLYEATGGDKAKVANISGHSLATIDAIIEKHYFVRHAALSRDAGGMLEDLMRKIGYAG